MKNSRTINFRQIEAFRAVMVSGSASRAAELLEVTQPAISRGILELERNIGFALFDRVKGRLLPTADGQIFFRDVTASFLGLDSLRSSAARIRDFGSGDIRFASHAAMGSTLVPHAIKLFMQKHVSAAITLQVTSSSQVRDLVASGRFDIGLAADEIDLSGIDHQTFATPKAVCAIPAGHKLAELKLIHPEHLDGERFIALAPEDTVRRRLEEILANARARPKIVMETPNSATVCALAMEGIGVGLVNPYSTDGYASRGVVFRPFSAAVHFKSLMIFRPGVPKPRLVRALVSALISARNAKA